MGKLLALVTFARGIYNKWLFQRLLTGILVIAALTIIAAILAGAAVVIGFYAVYVMLLHQGFPQEQALAMLCGMVAMSFIILLIIIMRSIRKLHHLPRNLIREKLPIGTRAGETINAFIDGLLSD